MTDYSVNTGNDGKLTLTVNQSSQDIADNSTLVAWSLNLSSTYSGTFTNADIPWTVKIDGQTYNGTFSFNFNNYSSLKIAGGNTRVDHDADGSIDPITVYGYIGNTGTSSIGGPASKTGTKSLTTIPRASKATFSDSSMDAGTAVTIDTNRASSSFTHTITYKFGSATGQIGATKFTSATVSWTPSTGLLSQIPNTTSGTGTITTNTYSGSTLIGTTTTGFTLKVPASALPTFSNITSSETTPNVATDIGKFVQNVSKLLLTMTGAAGIYGSTPKTYKITTGSQTINAVSGTTGPITQSGSVTITGTVTDSRGRSYSKNVTVTVLAYAPPKITSSAFSVQRALSSGVVDDNGTYIRANLNISVSDLTNGTQRNTMTYKISTRLRGTLPWTAATPVVPGGISYVGFGLVGTFALEQSWEVIVTVTDKYSSTVIAGTVSTATIFMHWGAGLGVGKFWEKGALDVGGDAYVTRLRIAANNDAGLTSTTHGLQIGDSAADNLVIDTNEIMARNNGAASTWLGIQADGGDIQLGKANDSTVTIPGYLRITQTGDASAGSTTHGLQIGDTAGSNTIIDNNEIIFRNNGVQVAQVLSTTSMIPWANVTDSVQTISGTSAMVAASGWSITAQSIVVKNGIAVGQMSFTRTGAAITVPASGNIANQTVATTTNAAYRPAFRTPLAMLAGGPVVGGEVTTAGDWRFNAMAPGNTIATGDTFEVGAMWIL